MRTKYIALLRIRSKYLYAKAERTSRVVSILALCIFSVKLNSKLYVFQPTILITVSLQYDSSVTYNFQRY